MPSGRVWCGRRARGCDRAEDLHNLPVAVSTQGAQGVVEIRVGLVVIGSRGSGRAEEVSRAGDRGASLAIGEQPEVADADEAAREHVQQEAPQEFLDAERHDLRPSSIRVILPAELDDAVDEPDEAGV